MPRKAELYYTHVNRGIIDANRKHGEDTPPFTIKRGKNGKPTYARRVRLPAGAELVYGENGEAILPCGARAVIVSTEAPEVLA